MKNFHFGLMAMAMTAVIGCTEATPGGPGATGAQPTTAMKPDLGEAEQTFAMNTPLLSTHLKQGGTAVASISLSRGTNFDEDVAINFEEVPTGVTLDPAVLVISRGEKDANVTLRATETAALGNFTVKVTGHPTKGADAKSVLKLTVDSK